MKVRFYIDSKISKDGKAVIWCYLREHNNTVTVNSGERIKPEFWDKDTYRPDPNKTKSNIVKGELKNIKQALDELEIEFHEIRRTLRRRNRDTGFFAIAEEIKRTFNRKEIRFFEVFDEFVAFKKLNLPKSSVKKFERVKTLLEEYERVKSERLTFETLTPAFFPKFNVFLIENKKLYNMTASKYISFLKTFLIWANDNGFTVNISYKSYKIKSEKNEVIYLTEDELMTLFNLELDDKKLERVRDLFVFQCFTGVRYSDIENFSREDIDGATWKLRTQKTRQIIEIPLNSYAISILEKYKDFPTPLPVISNQKMNDYLKDLCEEAKIDSPIKLVRYKGNERVEKTKLKYEVISTHTARRTFISLSLQKGMKPDVIMAITGHTTYRMMQNYLKIAEEHKRDEMDKVWGSPLRKVNIGKGNKEK